MARVAATGEPVQVADLRESDAYRRGDRLAVTGVDDGGIRTVLAVPMLKDKELIGVIAIYRREVRRFTDKQVELVTNFASQAVIAIENARLLNELQESLQQQTAASDVLRLVSSSRGELQPVFEAALENATRLCDAKFGNLLLRTEDGFRYVAMHGLPSEYLSRGKSDPIVDIGKHPRSPLGQLARSNAVVHIFDLAASPAYLEREARIVTLVETAKARTLLAVPMLHEKELVGAIVVYRQEVRPFTREADRIGEKLRRAGRRGNPKCTIA